MIKIFLCIILVVIYPSLGFSAEYYAESVRGNNANDGLSIDLPWLTLGYAINQLQAGDTLYLREGVFYESELVISNSGTAQNWITIKAWENEQSVRVF